MSTAKVLLRVPKSGSHHRQRNPLHLAFAHGSTEAFFPPSNRRPPSLRTICVRSRKISAYSAYVEGKPLGEQNLNRQNMDREARIRKHLQNPKFLPSPYDTAWVAMVPLRGSLQAPCFPQCVEWILQNQHRNGYWALNEFDSSANRDVLLSTLACVIALKKWNVGPEEIRRGLRFIGRNFSVIMDEQTAAPIGYNLTFSSLLILAIQMGLELPVSHTDINIILHLRELEVKRFVNKSFGMKLGLLFYLYLYFMSLVGKALHIFWDKTGFLKLVT